jgi:hypothetical protein
MAKNITPPQGILLLLWPFKGESCYPQIVGDLSEEFQQQAEHGLSDAHRWYYKEICRNFWSLIWRWVTIPAIIVPLLCAYMSDAFLHFFANFMRFMFTFLQLSLISRMCTEILLIPILIGLSLGIICSWMLMGHERLLRLMFGVFQIGLLTFTHLMAIKALSSDPVMRFYLIGLIYFRPICTLIFFWMGSVWMERHHHARHQSA